MLLNIRYRRAFSAVAAVSVALFTTISLSRAQERPTLALATEKSGLRLTIAVDQSSYRSGEPIHVTAQFKNISDGPVRVFVARPSEVCYRFTVVRMEAVNSAVPVELTSFGKEHLDLNRHIGTRSWMLPRDESVDASFDIGPWYVMPPGTYKIASYIDMPTTTTFLSRLRFVSNELTITIAP